MFKVCGKYNISTFQAIVFNYITCVITGSLFNGTFPINNVAVEQDWFKWACLMGVMFIAIFNVVAITTRKIGIAVASVANKLSLIIPVVLSVYLYNESVKGLKLIGVILALGAVILTCFPSKQEEAIEEEHLKKSSKLILLLPLLLFISSGILDSLINHVQKNYVAEENKNAFLITGFFSAGCIGIAILVVLVLLKKIQLQPKAIIAGIAIGIPNYFSIWCMVNFLKTSPWQSSASLPVNNMGIVLFSAVAAWLFFKEKLSAINWAGVALSLISIYLIAFGDSI